MMEKFNRSHMPTPGKISYGAVAIPLVGGLVSAALVQVSTWSDLRSSLLPAVSIIAAAVLVRLARGLPFTNADHFTLEQFSVISERLNSNARKLRALIFVCLAAIALLVLTPNIYAFFCRIMPQYAWVQVSIGSLISFLLGLSISYAFVRIVEVVHSDVALMQAQSTILSNAISAKNAKTFDDTVKASKTPGITGSGKFGGKFP